MLVEGLDGRVAVVTGAQRGIGLAIVESLKRCGARVAALDLQPPVSDGVLGLGCDVRDELSVNDAFDQVEEKLGLASVLVMNAGVYPVVPFEETSLAVWNNTIAINLTGAFLCARRVLPAMRAARYGRLVAIGSSAGKAGGAKSVAAYAASKAGIMTLAKSIASEYASYGVTSNALAPALIDTDMIAGTKDLLAKIPVGRFGTVSEVADLVTFLCSGHAGYITGEVVDINGGFLID